MLCATNMQAGLQPPSPAAVSCSFQLLRRISRKPVTVISALEEHNVQVTALHSHMLTEQPRLFFMHFWTAGNTESVAQGIKVALTHIATK
jgi:hypothetical protein